jgi:phosphoglycolate phosphatase-like HAD superfamily hydrolase
MFDVDGTLVKSFDFDEECFISAVSEVLGHEIDSDWDSYEHVSDTGILNEHLNRQGITTGHEEIHLSVKRAFIKKVQEYLLENPAMEVEGASELIKTLKEYDSVSLSIATGGWQETALLKLQSAGIDVSGIPIASSNDHYSRIEIMRLAKQMANICCDVPVTYFGDAAWDQKACDELGFNFVLVGNRIHHKQSVKDLTNTSQILSLIGV